MAINTISVERRSFAVEVLRNARRTRRVGPIIVGDEGQAGCSGDSEMLVDL